jgi:hypothetical protein
MHCCAPKMRPAAAALVALLPILAACAAVGTVVRCYGLTYAERAATRAAAAATTASATATAVERFEGEHGRKPDRAALAKIVREVGPEVTRAVPRPPALPPPARSSPPPPALEKE